MWCPKCGNQVPDNSKFCPKCGHNLKEEQKLAKDHDLQTEKKVTQEKRPEKKRKTVLYLIISIAVLILAAAGGFAFYHFVLGGDKKTSSQTKTAYEKEEDTQEIEQHSKKDEQESENVKKPDEETLSLEETTAAAPMEATTVAPVSAEHTYQLIVKDCTWTQAYQGAKAMGGYLVNINSADEYDKIKNLIAASGLQSMKFWVGGMRTSGSYDYHWIDANGALDTEILNSGDYTFQWMVNEPSFRDGSVEETYMNIFYYNKENRWVWNDVPDNIIAIVPSYSGSVGYICEFDY